MFATAVESGTVSQGVIESLIEMQKMQPVAEMSAQGGTPTAPAERMRAPTPVPAWLTEERPKPVAEPEALVVEDTLQQSRERVASRWFALRELFEQGPQEKAPEVKKAATGEVPVLAVFSLAGGVGKTSLVATLGRALSSTGRKGAADGHDLAWPAAFLLWRERAADRAWCGRSLRRVGSTDAPIYLVSYDAEQGSNEEAQERLVEEISGNRKGTHRILLDLTPGSGVGGCGVWRR